jgi:hypothetical protein
MFVVVRAKSNVSDFEAPERFVIHLADGPRCRCATSLQISAKSRSSCLMSGSSVFFQQGADTVSLGPGNSQANPCDVSTATATREADDTLNCFDIESKTRRRHRRPGRDERLLIRLPSLVGCQAIGRFLMFARLGCSFLPWVRSFLSDLSIRLMLRSVVK